MSKEYSFKRMRCTICGEEISKAGAAYTSHMRMHVRRDEVIELKRGKKCVFISKDALVSLLDKEPYALLGEEPLPRQPKDVWDITSALKELKAVNPNEYYITSGEAVKKAEKLVKDAYSLAVKSKAFLKKLQNARGKKKFLETSREENRLLVKSKNPRSIKKAR